MVASHGGALVSKIHEQTRHGDPFVRDFMDRILEEVHTALGRANPRCPNHSSRLCKDGSLPGSYTTRFKSSLSSSTQKSPFETVELHLMPMWASKGDSIRQEVRMRHTRLGRRSMSLSRVWYLALSAKSLGEK